MEQSLFTGIEATLRNGVDITDPAAGTPIRIRGGDFGRRFRKVSGSLAELRARFWLGRRLFRSPRFFLGVWYIRQVDAAIGSEPLSFFALARLVEKATNETCAALLIVSPSGWSDEAVAAIRDGVAGWAVPKTVPLGLLDVQTGAVAWRRGDRTFPCFLPVFAPAADRAIFVDCEERARAALENGRRHGVSAAELVNGDTRFAGVAPRVIQHLSREDGYRIFEEEGAGPVLRRDGD